MVVEKNITWKKGRGEQYHLPHNIKAVGKNIKKGTEEEDENVWEENQDIKKWGWGKISSCRNFIHPRKFSLFPAL